SIPAFDIARRQDMSMLAGAHAPDTGSDQVEAGTAHKLSRYFSHPLIAAGALILGTIALTGLLAPMLAGFDPTAIDPSIRNKPPGFVQVAVATTNGAEVRLTHWLGTDGLGRDVLSRILYGIRVSLAIGFIVSAISVSAGVMLGVISGYLRWLDGI